MKKRVGITLAATLLLTLAAFSSSCTTTPASTTSPPATQITVPTPTAPDPKPTQVPKMKIAEDFIQNTATYKFDGIEGSLKLIKAENFSPISSFRAMTFNFEFQTRHPGHGDRTGQILAQVITTHTAVLYLDVDKDSVRIATCDGVWDLIRDKEIPPPSPTAAVPSLRQEVYGVVISGGDTAVPDGPLDVPHKFVYKIQKEDGTFVNVSYTAYPPSPVGDAARAKITLSFYNGEIKAGDYLKAYGTYNKDTNAIVVAEQGDFIKTYPVKGE